MNTNITAEDLTTALERPVLVASAYDSKTGKRKVLEYFIHESEFKTTFTDRLGKTTTTNIIAKKAVESYNCFYL